MEDFLVSVTNGFSEKLNPLLLATGAMLAMASLRNSDIASRARANVIEVLERNDKIYGKDRSTIDIPRSWERIESLKEQNQTFLLRHASTSQASVGLGLCVFLIVAEIFVSSFKKHEWAQPLSGLILILFCLVFAYSAYLLVKEFRLAIDTLKINNSITEVISKTDEDHG